MAEVDTSSYPKPGLPVSPLDLAGKLGSLQQQKLQIDQQKLDQANQGLTYMTRAMGALGPDAPKDAYIKAASDAVKLGLVPENQLQVFVEKAQAAPTSQDFFNEFMTTAADHQQQINYHLGQRVDVNNGQTSTPAVTSVKPGFGVRPVGLPIQQQNPPNTPTVNANNQSQLLGPQPTQVPEGTIPANTGIPGQYRPSSLPVEPLQPSAAAPSTAPATFAQRTDAAFPKPAGPISGTSPLFEEGKKSYTEDQLSASARSQAIKPAIQALKLMPGLATGPGTAQFNDLVAAAKAWGIVDTKAENDPTVLRQEIEKKLAQYVGGSPIANRSDAAQTLAEAGFPNPKKQILPALQNLTRDAIALERVNILKPQAFKGTDYQNYIKHQGTFPGGIDEKALSLDMIPEEQRAKLVNRMVNQYKNGNADEKARANKFLNTLKLASEHKIFEGAQ